MFLIFFKQWLYLSLDTGIHFTWNEYIFQIYLKCSFPSQIRRKLCNDSLMVRYRIDNLKYTESIEWFLRAITLRRSPPLQNSMASNGNSPSVTLSSEGTSLAAMTLGWFKRFMMSTSKVHLSLCLRFISPGTRHFFSAMYSSRLWKDYGKKAFILQIKLIIIHKLYILYYNI